MASGPTVGGDDGAREKQRLDAVSDDSSSQNRLQGQPSNLNLQQDAVPSTRDLPSGNGPVNPENRIKLNLKSRSKHEKRDLRRKLESELDTVRSLVKRIEVKQGQVGGYSNSNLLTNDRVGNGGGAKRVHSEVASAGVPREITRPLHQLSISVLENSQGLGDYVEKEKRTPKANQFYRNSEFLLAKDKFPPAESNKKSKLNGKKQGWRRNGTWEFAEDVRLTFRNAMTYNPEGQDVHVMSEQLSKIFEDRWAIIESDYNREMRYGLDYGAVLPTPTPTSRKAPPFPPPPLDMRRIMARSESMNQSFDRTPRLMSITPSSRTPAPKKPKAKDPHKRDMTYEEKQKLSTNLQTVDAETLWELDRFVTNYKKSLSKNKRKAELAILARAEAQPNYTEKVPVVSEVPKEIRTDERNVSVSMHVQREKQVDNGSRSSSSSSSSSDSGSSSSDSDSESSSASGSDAGSPKT
ncbi:Transcription factor GTE4 [Quillaja saponaria]|uniref:Transcription factor GTE4 n=1 Tax=Quillaja saponaria TaxID=32244 RepID=A0AAD7QHF3_QUISA|nr:Transcription factor GTE4 [Quillaja saponaria]